MINSQSLSVPVGLSCEMYMYFIIYFFSLAVIKSLELAGFGEMSFLRVE